MKKAILLLTASVFALSSYAQTTDFDSTMRIESDKVLNLSADQIAKIKELNREAGLKFRAIGESSVPGYEKGQKKKALALRLKDDIRKVLTPQQIEAWESRYGSMEKDDGLRDILKDYYDDQLELLEDRYEKERNRIERSSISKDTKKDRLDKLKCEYKAEKERLKKQRDNELDYMELK